MDVDGRDRMVEAFQDQRRQFSRADQVIHHAIAALQRAHALNQPQSLQAARETPPERGCTSTRALCRRELWSQRFFFNSERVANRL